MGANPKSEEGTQGQLLHYNGTRQIMVKSSTKHGRTRSVFHRSFTRTVEELNDFKKHALATYLKIDISISTMCSTKK